jgi:NADH dehydrogenase FAD-containing subunit
MAESRTQIVVIGAGYGGLLATVRLAGKTRRRNVEITLVNAADVFVERLQLRRFAANQAIKRHDRGHAARDGRPFYTAVTGSRAA